MLALMLEIAGEYDKIYDPASGQTGVDVIEVPGTAIPASALKKPKKTKTITKLQQQ